MVVCTRRVVSTTWALTFAFALPLSLPLSFPIPLSIPLPVPLMLARPLRRIILALRRSPSARAVVVVVILRINDQHRSIAVDNILVPEPDPAQPAQKSIALVPVQVVPQRMELFRSSSGHEFRFRWSRWIGFPWNLGVGPVMRR